MNLFTYFLFTICCKNKYTYTKKYKGKCPLRVNRPSCFWNVILLAKTVYSSCHCFSFKSSPSTNGTSGNIR